MRDPPADILAAAEADWQAAEPRDPRRRGGAVAPAALAAMMWRLPPPPAAAPPEPRLGLDSSALMVAVHRGIAGVVEELLARGAPVDTELPNGVTALVLAVEAGSEPLVRALLAAGGRADAGSRDGCSALGLAATHARMPAAESLVRLLVGAGADMERRVHLRGRDAPAVWHAAAAGRTTALTALAEAGARVDCVDATLTSAVAAAACGGWLEALHELGRR